MLVGLCDEGFFFTIYHIYLDTFKSHLKDPIIYYIGLLYYKPKYLGLYIISSHNVTQKETETRLKRWLKSSVSVPSRLLTVGWTWYAIKTKWWFCIAVVRTAVDYTTNYELCKKYRWQGGHTAPANVMAFIEPGIKGLVR